MEVKDANTNTLQGLLQQYRLELMAALSQKKNRFELTRLKSIMAELRQLIRERRDAGYRKEAFSLVLTMAAML